MSVNGLFITIEGIDGAGKSTQAQRLAVALRARGLEVVLTREPGGTRLGAAMRDLLLDPEVHLSDWAECFLYLSDRALHVAEVIRPALDAGRCVVAERFADSTLAYQCYGRGLDLDLVRQLNGEAAPGLTPALTVLLDVPPETGAGRRATHDRIEAAGLAMHRRVRDGYLALAKEAPSRFVVIDATQAADRVAAEVLAAVERVVATRGVR